MSFDEHDNEGGFGYCSEIIFLLDIFLYSVYAYSITPFL